MTRREARAEVAPAGEHHQVSGQPDTLAAPADRASGLANRPDIRTLVEHRRGTSVAHSQGDPEVVHYDPRRYLQGLVQDALNRAVQRDRAVHVEGPWPSIALYPGARCAIVFGPERELRRCAGTADLPAQARLTFTPAPCFRPNHPYAVPLDGLIWKLALAASRGRLPRGVDLDTLCSLRDWPNVTRLVLTPGALSVAALWTREPYTLRQTVRLLGLPPGDVFVFYSAAAALGLIDHTRPARPPLAEPEQVTDSPRRGLLRRMLDLLRTG